MLILAGIATAAGTIAVALFLAHVVHVMFENVRSRRSPRFPTARPLLDEGRAGSMRVEPTSPAAVVTGSVGERILASVEAPPKAAPPPAPPERSVDVNESRESNIEESERQADQPEERGTDGEASVGGESAAYRQVGDDVTEVLAAAERAAARIRETAGREADEIRTEAEARRAEADAYSDETRAAADAYAEATRRESDEEAAGKVSQAEEEARRIRAEAEEKAREIQADAVRHRDELARSAEGMEERVRSMLTAFREAASDLEGLLPQAERDRADGSEAPSREALDDALKPDRPSA